MALPLDLHPIYCLRKWAIIIAVVGIILCCITIPMWGGLIVIPTTIFLVLSVLFCGADLVLYAIKKVKDPDSDPEWPTRKWMIGDLVLAVFLQYLFWGTLPGLNSIYFFPAFAAYGALAGLLCSVLHARSFWKQYLARTEKRWLANLPHQPCARCGYLESVHEPFPRQEHPNVQPPNTFAYAGPSANLRHADVLTPDSRDSAMEEGLLIGSEIGTGYGSIENPESEPTIYEPEEVVVRKGKGRRASRTVLGKAAGK